MGEKDLDLVTKPIIWKNQNIADMEIFFITNENMNTVTDVQKHFKDKFDIPIQSLREIARKHNWLAKREAYFADFYKEMGQKIKAKRMRYKMVSADQSMQLAQEIHSKLLRNIKDDTYIPTVTDYSKAVGSVLKAVGEEDGANGININKSKSININLGGKNIDDLSIEEYDKIKEQIIDAEFEEVEDE